MEGYRTLEDAQGSRPIFFKLLAEENQGQFGALGLIKFVPSDSAVDVSSVSYLAMKDYSGTVSRYDDEGKLLTVELYAQGKLQNVVKGETLANARPVSPTTNYEPPPDCDYCDDNPPKDGLVLVIIQMYVDTYVIKTVGSYVSVYYAGSTYTGSRAEWVSVPRNSHHTGVAHEHRRGGSGGSSGGGNISPPHPKDIILDPSFKNSKIECVYKEFKKTGAFDKYIKRFDGAFSVAHLILTTSASLGSARRALTTPPNGPVANSSPDYTITIAFNSDNSSNGYNQRPTLLNVKTLMHEVIHAELYRKLMSVAQKGNLNPGQWTQQEQVNYVNGLRQNFPGIYDYSRRYVNNWQHAQMATHYRETIAGALQEFDNSSHPWQFYMDLAWEGLRDSNVSSWNSLSSSEKNRITTVINNFRQTGSKACP